MRRCPSLRATAIYAVLLALPMIASISLPQSAVYAQSKSASIVSLNTDKTSYFSGEMVTITLVTRNTGNTAVQILCNIVIINPAGSQVYSYSRKYDISAGATNSYEFYWTATDNSISGNYQVQSTIADGQDGRFYSSRSTSFVRNSPTQSPRSASMLSLSVDRESYLQGETAAIIVFMQNTGGGTVGLRVAAEVVNPSGAQVYNGVRETIIEQGYTDKVAFNLPIPDNAGNGIYQIQATIADKIDGKLYGSKTTTLYVQSAMPASVVVNKNTSGTVFQLPNLGISGWGQYLIMGLLIALTAVVVCILIRNRPREKSAITGMEIPKESAPEEEKTQEPL